MQVIYGHSLDAADVWEDANLKQQMDLGDETVVDYFRCLARQHSQSALLGSAPARLLCLLRARLVALGSSVLPE